MKKNRKEKYIVAGYKQYTFTVKDYSIVSRKTHIANTEGNSYTAELEGESFKGEILQLKQNKCTVLLNGNTYTFLIGKEETVKRTLRYKSDEGSNISLLKSPMPGKIVDILATKGSKVEKGEPLVVLEAMKMQNLLQAEESGTIVAIHPRIGDSVLGDQVLVEIAKQ